MDMQDLAGKTIATATVMKKEMFDDERWLKLEFTDGNSCVFVAGYEKYTGKSEDEYQVFIGIAHNSDGLVPV